MAAAPHPHPRPRQSAEASREDVLRAAVAEFAQHGLHGTSTEDIARRAGVSQPYVFRLFGSKKALFLAAVERCNQHVLDAFRSAAADGEKAGGDIWAAMGLAYVSLLADRDELLLTVQSFAACGDPEVAEVARQGFGAITRFLASQPGASDEMVPAFTAEGMLLLVAAAIDLPALLGTEDWARMLFNGMPEFLSQLPATGGERS